MKRLLYVLALAVAFFALPLANRQGPFVSVAALVLVGVGLALLASAHANAISVGTGAFAALGAGVMGTTSPAAAGAVFLMLVFAERTMRVRGNVPRAVHVLLSLIAGGMSGAITSMYVNAQPLVYGVACATAAVVAGLPLLIDADHPVAHALDLVAADLPSDVRDRIREGATLLRESQDIPLDADVEKDVQSTWKSLLKLSHARAKVETHARNRTGKHVQGVVAMLDKRIAEHVSLLSRAFTATDTANAARLGMDDAALKSVKSASLALEASGEAMVDVDSAL
jgi:hypothetical protein